MAVSLTAGMRSNLFSLQQTAKLMDQTAIRLNTGKKVNSALDDPISYFTAKGHMSRVADLGTLKNGMSEGIQTITAANSGIESVIALIESAKSKAVSAKSAEAGGTGFDTATITLVGVGASDTITVNGTLYTATDADVTAGAKEFNIGVGQYATEITALNLASVVNSTDETAGTVKNVTADVSGTTLSLASTYASMAADTITSSSAAAFTASMTLVAASDERASLAAQYETLVTQIQGLRDDAGYKGVNLMSLDDTLTVDFEGAHKLTVDGFDATIVTGLGMGLTAQLGWSSDDDIDADIAAMNAAISKLESNASSLASSLSIVSARQDFTENMMNALTTGADNLTLADMNEEGANMLMLQTQQALGTNSLSLAAQTAQGVLRLF